MSPARSESMPVPGRMPLALALAGLPRDVPARVLIDHASALGFRAIQLDAAHPELRPRDLTRSARKDLAALLRRSGLVCAGIDLFVPPAHLADGARVDHAVSALALGLEMVAELALLTGCPPVLSGSIPAPCASDVSDAASASLAQAAINVGARLADHTWTSEGHARARAGRGDPIGIGIDPAGALLAGASLAKAVARLGASDGPGIIAARLSDSDGASRLAPGAHLGQLDAITYAVALHSAGYQHHVVLDLRGVPDPLAAAARARDRFDLAG